MSMSMSALKVHDRHLYVDTAILYNHYMISATTHDGKTRE